LDILIDDALVDSGFIDNQTVAQTLRHLQQNICAPGQVVVALRCDGEDVAADHMTAALARSAANLDKLEVFTSTKERLVVDAMSQASAVLDKTEAACDAIADLLTTGKTAQGMQDLGECLRHWQQVHQAVGHAIQMLQIDVENTTLAGRPLAEVVARPRDVLLQIKRALESADHVLLADVMRYELGGVTDAWFSIIAMLRRRAEEHDDSSA